MSAAALGLGISRDGRGWHLKRVGQRLAASLVVSQHLDHGRARVPFRGGHSDHVVALRRQVIGRPSGPSPGGPTAVEHLHARTELGCAAERSVLSMARRMAGASGTEQVRAPALLIGRA